MKSKGHKLLAGLNAWLIMPDINITSNTVPFLALYFNDNLFTNSIKIKADGMIWQRML